MKQRAVFGDDTVEDAGVRKNLEEVVQPPSRDEHQPQPRVAAALERLERPVVDAAAVRDRPVVVSRERQVQIVPPCQGI